MVTTASIFFQTLAQAGVTHAFVNWGNDHPAFLEDLERQRSESADGSTQVQIVTCPNEMVALSAAQGYAQITRRPAAVIVHVDVGTQALAGAVHNVDRTNIPVLIFSGASAFSSQGEHIGSKNEWPMWVQDVPDQAGVVRQYMRFTSKIHSGRTAAKTILRALQIAKSDPKGPVYLYAHREILSEEVEDEFASANIDHSKWPQIQSSALSPNAVGVITRALVGAKFPLLITSHAGRNPQTVPLVTKLSEHLSIALTTSCSSVISVPYSHPNYIGSYTKLRNHFIDEADVILIVDTDVPWIETHGSAPQKDARLFVIDIDPLKPTMGWSHVDAELICRADAEVALTQLLEAAQSPKHDVNVTLVKQRAQELKSRHDRWIAELEAKETAFRETVSGANIIGILRRAVQEKTPSRGTKTLWLDEAASNLPVVFDHVRPDAPGSFMCSGVTALGWALGAAVGARLGARVIKREYELIVAVVGDGVFLFGVPSSAFWIARRYNTPYLTIVLNNGGWASPRNSMLGVYPDGYGSKASGQRLTIGFGPEMPDYGGIAAAAGGAWSQRAESVDQAKKAIEEGIRVVLEEKRCAVVECMIEPI